MISRNGLLLCAATWLTLFACNVKSERKVKPAVSMQEKIRPATTHASEYSYIVFGRFCGECGGKCAVMYKMDLNTGRLFADHTDSYWKHARDGSMQFATEIRDPAKIKAATQITASIPTIVADAKSETMFGCPDCADGCGIHFEFRKGDETKVFAIDYQTSQLEGEIKDFAEVLKDAIEAIENK